MKKQTLFLIIAISFITGCTKTEEQCSDFPLVASNISDQEEYLILEAIIDTYFSNVDLIHLSQESHSMPDSSRFASYFNSDELEFEPDKIEEYVLINSSPFVWGESFKMQRDLISQEELNCLFDSNANGWMAYFAKYGKSDAYLKFGRPIQDDDRAIITYEYLCGWECSSGYTVTLKKENNEWFVEKHLLIWIS